ncbi:MAG: hypothetical protein F6K11_01345 [Leptolyngbya sp. SIO3F4]|nr:hypothetical protein [Leptolyngbya sp. SIO3F4]
MLPDAQELETLMLAIDRRIFNEQQLLVCHRDRFLESQLRSSQISVGDFMRSCCYLNPESSIKSELIVFS